MSIHFLIFSLNDFAFFFQNNLHPSPTVTKWRTAFSCAVITKIHRPAVTQQCLSCQRQSQLGSPVDALQILSAVAQQNSSLDELGLTGRQPQLGRLLTKTQHKTVVRLRLLLKAGKLQPEILLVIMGADGGIGGGEGLIETMGKAQRGTFIICRKDGKGWIHGGHSFWAAE